jgi:predicted transcriptional regulator
MTTETERLQIAGELREMLEALQGETLPEYDPEVEITVADLAQKINCGRGRAQRMIEEKVQAGTMTARFVMLPTGQRAKAYRPIKK